MELATILILGLEVLKKDEQFLYCISEGRHLRIEVVNFLLDGE